MNNVMINENGQQISVSLIAYFSSNNVNYLFYSKNETVQDDLVKMYVAKENSGANDAINDDEWNNLKKVMQGIIMGNPSVTYINYTNPVSVGVSRAIALKNDNITSIVNSYNSGVSTDASSGGTNKDLLNQSFATPAPQVEVQVENPIQSEVAIQPEVPTQPNIPLEQTNPVQGEATIQPEVPVQPDLTVQPEVIEQVNGVVPEVQAADTNVVDINPIPNVQNNLNLEATPVNLDTSVPDVPANTGDTLSPFDPTLNIEPIVPEMPIDNANSNEPTVNSVDEPLTINSITPADSVGTPTITEEDNSFKVSSEPNIFDQVQTTPSISEPEAINVIDTNLDSSVSETTPNVTSPTNTSLDNGELIELNERKIKLFEELANIYKEENKILSSNNAELDKTASNLFNSNGTLNENMVLDTNN